MRISTLLSFLAVPAVASATLITSASLDESSIYQSGEIYKCPAVSEEGVSSAHVVQTCSLPYTPSSPPGEAGATAALGELSASVMLNQDYSFPNPSGEASAGFSAPMIAFYSQQPSLPVLLQFRVHVITRTGLGFDAQGSANTMWTFNGLPLGTFIGGYPPFSYDEIDTEVVWTAPSFIRVEDGFHLGGRVTAVASDDFGDAQISASLLGVTAINLNGQPVAGVTVAFVPEPGTGALVFGGLGLILLLLPRLLLCLQGGARVRSR